MNLQQFANLAKVVAAGLALLGALVALSRWLCQRLIGACATRHERMARRRHLKEELRRALELARRAFQHPANSPSHLRELRDLHLSLKTALDTRWLLDRRETAAIQQAGRSLQGLIDRVTQVETQLEGEHRTSALGAGASFLLGLHEETEEQTLSVLEEALKVLTNKDC